MSTTGVRVAAIFVLLLAASILVGGASTAAPSFFGAALTSSSQPANAETGKACSDELAGARSCTWLSVRAYQNAGRERAPRTGMIGEVRLVSCVGGSLRIQLASAPPGQPQAKVVRAGRLIRYAPDPRQVDDDPDTVCGGDEGNDFVVQRLPVNLSVKKGEYIAILAARTGALYCSGGSGIRVFSPPLVVGKPARRANETVSCNLLVSLHYG